MKFENGSEVLRFDCHLHTVKDKEFKYPGMENESISDYVDKLEQEKISIGIITNYNIFDLENFNSKKCPKCGEKGTPIYEEQTYERPKNNPTDIDAFFKHKRSTN